MKFFNLLHICLMSFLIVPFAYGMTFFPEEYFSLSSSQSSNESIELDPLPTEMTSSKENPVSTAAFEIIESQNKPARTLPDVQQKMVQYGQLTKKLNVMESDLFTFNTFKPSSEKTSLQQKELAEKLKINLQTLENPDFKEIDYLSEPLKKKISIALEKYDDERESEKKHALKTIITSTQPTESISHTFINEVPRITIKETIHSLPYPNLTHPLAQAFTFINTAIDNNKEDPLINAIKSFQRLYKNFEVLMSYFRVENAYILKQDMFKNYLLNLSTTNQTPDKVVDEISEFLPFFLNEIEFYQRQQNTAKNEELMELLDAHLLTTLSSLKQTNPTLTKNIDLIQEILSKTRLNKTTKQACLLLLNKAGKFYPQIASDLAIIIIDDIAANYFTLSEQSQSQTQNNKLIAQTIQLLALVQSLEPLLSARLHISNMSDTQLEGYLKKIHTFTFNMYLPPSTKQILQYMESLIFDEINKRLEHAVTQAKLKSVEQEKTQEIISKETNPKKKSLKRTNKTLDIKKLDELEKEINTFLAEVETPLAVHAMQAIMADVQTKPWDNISKEDYIELREAIQKYGKEEPSTVGQSTVKLAYELLEKIDDILGKQESLHKDYLAALSNTKLVNKIKDSAGPLLSSSKASIDDEDLKPILKYTDQLIKNKAATGKDGVIVANHFKDIAETIDLLRKIAHVLDPKDSSNKNNLREINTRIQWLMYNINNRDKNELIQQIKERKGRFNHPEKNIIKDIINDYYFSSYAHSFIEPLFAAKNSILAAIETMESQRNAEPVPVIPIIAKGQPETPSVSISTQEPTKSPVVQEPVMPKQDEVNAQQVLNIFPQNLKEKQPTAQQIPQEQINQTPSFWENIINTISSWFNWFFWEQYKS